jgi:hypothetical protein
MERTPGNFPRSESRSGVLNCMDDAIHTPNNPYDPANLLKQAKKSVLKNRPGLEPVKPSEQIKSYSVEEAMKLEIIPVGYGGEDFSQTFTDHFAEVAAASEAIAQEKERMGTSVALGGKLNADYKVKDLLASLKEKTLDGVFSSLGSIAIEEASRQCPPILDPHHPERRKSDE